MVKTSYANYIFKKLARLIDELSIRGIHVCILNDPAITLYGIIKSIDEIRVLIENKDLDTIAYIVSKELGMSIYEKDISRSLKSIGKAVLNPVFIPLTIVETANSELDKLLLENILEFKYEDIWLNIPRIEYLIAKLLAYNAYPYNLYAYTLLLSHREIIDQELLKNILHLININYDDIEQVMNKAKRFIDTFPETNP
jgi:hypothetical protein